MNGSLIRCENLSWHTRDGRLLASNVNLSIRSGGVTLIQGPNGVGKTTLLLTLLGRHRFYSGHIDRQVSHRDIAYLPQLQNVNFHLPLTLYDVLNIACEGRLRSSESAAFGLLDERQLRLGWNTASGGERKKTLITRALLARPKLLVLDEPFNHLDMQSESTVSETLAQLVDSTDKPLALVMVAHGNRIAQRFRQLATCFQLVSLEA